MTKILSAPNQVLSVPSSPHIFKKGDKSLDLLIDSMGEALLSASDPKGVGLAAPQIGQGASVFITKPNDKSKILVFVNPVIEDSVGIGKRSTKRIKKLEGCLSLPNIWGEVLRSPEVTLSYQDAKGQRKKRVFKGFMATIVQHEMDHLDGVLFPKRVLEQKGRLYKSSKNEKGEDEFEELPI